NSSPRLEFIIRYICSFHFLLRMRQPACSTLFPYTTLFRSRWGILEESLNASRLGRVVGNGEDYATPFKDDEGNPTASYNAGSYIWGEEAVETPDGYLRCVVVSSSINHSVSQKHYLYPIPQNQRMLNDQLLQNPGY